jgi:hypothetical protein
MLGKVNNAEPIKNKPFIINKNVNARQRLANTVVV